MPRNCPPSSTKSVKINRRRRGYAEPADQRQLQVDSIRALPRISRSTTARLPSPRSRPRLVLLHHCYPPSSSPTALGHHPEPAGMTMSEARSERGPPITRRRHALGTLHSAASPVPFFGARVIVPRRSSEPAPRSGRGGRQVQILSARHLPQTPRTPAIRGVGRGPARAEASRRARTAICTVFRAAPLRRLSLLTNAPPTVSVDAGVVARRRRTTGPCRPPAMGSGSRRAPRRGPEPRSSAARVLRVIGRSNSALMASECPANTGTRTQMPDTRSSGMPRILRDSLRASAPRRSRSTRRPRSTGHRHHVVGDRSRILRRLGEGHRLAVVNASLAGLVAGRSDLSGELLDAGDPAAGYRLVGRHRPQPHQARLVGAALEYRHRALMVVQSGSGHDALRASAIASAFTSETTKGTSGQSATPTSCRPRPRQHRRIWCASAFEVAPPAEKTAMPRPARSADDVDDDLAVAEVQHSAG